MLLPEQGLRRFGLRSNRALERPGRRGATSQEDCTTPERGTAHDTSRPATPVAVMPGCDSPQTVCAGSGEAACSEPCLDGARCSHHRCHDAPDADGGCVSRTFPADEPAPRRAGVSAVRDAPVVLFRVRKQVLQADCPFLKRGTRGTSTRVSDQIGSEALVMRLSPRDREMLLVHVAAELARKRRSQGIRLNYPEAMAIITAYVLEEARAGRQDVPQLMDSAAKVVRHSECMEGVPEMMRDLAVEATFPDGTKMVVLQKPIEQDEVAV
jgi:urease subunit gamma